tara:strand:- start:750 stop:1073 length:324 start_codon:yes stop_codon:yes gene_type:complete
MSIIYTQDGSSGSAKTLRFKLNGGDPSGKVTLFSNLAASSSGDVDIKAYSGAAYVAYTIGGSAVKLDSNNSSAIIQGPGQYEVVIAADTPCQIHVTTSTNLDLISGF